MVHVVATQVLVDGGAILLYNDIIKGAFRGGKPNTTNNIMEMTAVIKALKALKKPCNVNLYSDSAYVVNAFYSIG